MMRSFIIKTAPVVALLFLFAGGPQLFAQWRRDQGYPDRGYGYGGGDPVNRAMADLQRASRGYGYMDHGDRKHVDSAMRNLQRFQANSRNGKFDKDRLDGAISDIQHLVDSNRVNGRDRQVLSNDLAALRAFRANRGYGRYNGGYGRYNPYGGPYGPYGHPY